LEKTPSFLKARLRSENADAVRYRICSTLQRKKSIFFGPPLPAFHMPAFAPSTVSVRLTRPPAAEKIPHGPAGVVSFPIVSRYKRRNVRAACPVPVAFREAD